MEQLNVEAYKKVSIDYNQGALPKSAGILQPLVYKENGQYHCLLGPDTQTGIYARGDTPEDAIIEWDVQLTSRLSTATEEDQTIQYVKDVYKAKNTAVW